MLSTVTLHNIDRDQEQEKSYTLKKSESSISNVFLKESTQPMQHPIQSPIQQSIQPQIQQSVQSPQLNTTLGVDLKNLESDKQHISVDLNKLQLGSITHKESETFVKNTSDKPQMSVLYNKVGKKFIFKDRKDKEIGYFDYLCVVKMVSSYFDHNNLFLSNIDIGYTNKASVKLVKKIVGKLQKVNKQYNVIIHNYNTSPFMGDIEMLIRLNNDLKLFEERDLPVELLKLDDHLRKKVNHYVKLFIYTLLSYTIELLSEVSEQIKGNPSKKTLAKHIIRYSVGSVYRLTNYSRLQHRNTIDKLDRLVEVVKKSHKIRQIIDKKLGDILGHIQDHNIQLQKLSANNRIYAVRGGGSPSISEKSDLINIIVNGGNNDDDNDDNDNKDDDDDKNVSDDKDVSDDNDDKDVDKDADKDVSDDKDDDVSDDNKDDDNYDDKEGSYRDSASKSYISEIYDL